jgi:hypothetical protein
MTLLIACLLVYNFHMEWWWYAVASVTWAGHLFSANPFVANLFN